MATIRRCLSTDEEFRQAVAESLSVRQVHERIGLVPAGGNYKTVHSRVKQLGLDTSHLTGAAWNQGARYKAFGRKATLEEVLVEHSPYAFTHGLRGRLLKRRLETASVRTLWLDKMVRAAYPVRTSSPQWHQQ